MVDTLLLIMATSAISMNNSRYINNQSLFGNRNRQSQKKNVKILPVSGVLSVVVIGEPKIHSFYSTHNQAKGPLLAWFQDAKKAKWKSPQDIKNRYAHASILSDNRVVFNIGGNKFRLNVMVTYQSGVVLIEDINTHANYDKKNKKK